MSNDLISREKVTQDISEIFADVLISSFRSETVSFDEVNRRVQECLKNQPAAYDVDEVVERLEELAVCAESKAAEYDEAGKIDRMNIHDGKAAAYKNTIRIVKSGGIECSNYLKNEDRQQEPADHETKSVSTVQNICEG